MDFARESLGDLFRFVAIAEVLVATANFMYHALYFNADYSKWNKCIEESGDIIPLLSFRLVSCLYVTHGIIINWANILAIYPQTDKDYKQH